MQMVLINVVAAVLLDKFVVAEPEAEEESQAAAEQQPSALA